jgi:hypothetical protein
MIIIRHEVQFQIDFAKKVIVPTWVGEEGQTWTLLDCYKAMGEINDIISRFEETVQDSKTKEV